MIKLSVGLLLINLSLTVVAVSEEQHTPKFPRGKGAELISDLKEGKIYGSLKNIARDKSKTIQLVGQAYLHQPKDQMLAGNTMVLIGWLGVQKINDPTKIIGFKEPVVSSFMLKSGTEIKGVELPTFGEVDLVIQAIDDLEQNKFDLQDLKKARTIKAPIGTSDYVTRNPGGTTKVQAVEPDLKDPDDSVTHEARLSDLVSNDNSNNASTARSSYSPLSNFGSNSTNELPNFQNSAGQANGNYNNSGNRRQEPTNLEPTTTIELTEEGCIPEHDALQERVIITARSQKLQNGNVIDRGVCERTLEFYPVKRDYLCEECIDDINLPDRKAYARYMEYWIDRESNRHNLGVRIDEIPFNIIEDNSGCTYKATDDYCSKMSKLGYINKFGIFKTVEGCRVIENTERFPVRTTHDGCPRIHDFVNNFSTIQSRVFFTKNGREHTVSSCTPTSETEHIFTDIGCSPVHHINNNFIHFARRMIVLDARREFITHECEPNPSNGINAWANLIGSTEECVNQYLHDFDAGKSYITKRYFYYDPRFGRELNKIYVTPCIRSNDFLEHQYQHDGTWEHDDQNLGSRAKLATFIVNNGARIQIDAARIRGNEELEPYTLEVRQEETQIFHIYTRPDGSIYRKFIREAP